MASQTKQCSKCHEHRTKDSFSKDRRTNDSLQKWCNPCLKDYRVATKAHRSEWHAQYHLANKDKLVEKYGAYYAANKAVLAEKRCVNKPRRRELTKTRRQTDPEWKLQNNIRTRIYRALKSSRKSAPSLELLGIPLVVCRQWLEYLFEPGMSWENYGIGWHIDHILPVSRFEMSDPSQQRICFAWTNLQPKWKRDNLAKSAAIVPHEFFNCLVSAHRFIQSRGLGRQEYQRLRESVAWLRETISGMVKISMDDELGKSSKMGNPQRRS